MVTMSDVWLQPEAIRGRLEEYLPLIHEHESVRLFPGRRLRGKRRASIIQ